MGAFGGMIQTIRGRNLQSKAQVGTPIQFTRIAIGDGQLGGNSILELNALRNQKKSLNITKLRTLNGGKAVVGAIISNQEIQTGFYWRELGLFAQDPDIGEILYCYANAGNLAEYIPAGGGPDVIEKTIDIISIVGNATNVNAVIDSSLVFASKQDIETLRDDINQITASSNNNLNQLSESIESHLAETMPHRFIDSGTDKTYRYGFSIVSGIVNFIYEEVI